MQLFLGLPSECIECKSLDFVPDESLAVEFPIEPLNSLEVLGVPHAHTFIQSWYFNYIYAHWTRQQYRT